MSYKIEHICILMTKLASLKVFEFHLNGIIKMKAIKCEALILLSQITHTWIPLFVLMFWEIDLNKGNSWLTAFASWNCVRKCVALTNPATTLALPATLAFYSCHKLSQSNSKAISLPLVSRGIRQRNERLDSVDEKWLPIAESRLNWPCNCTLKPLWTTESQNINFVSNTWKW